MFKWLKSFKNYIKESDYNNGKNCSTCVNYNSCQGMHCNWNPNEQTLIKIKEYSNSIEPKTEEYGKNICECCWKNNRKIYVYSEGKTTINICKDCFNEILLKVTSKVKGDEI